MGEIENTKSVANAPNKWAILIGIEHYDDTTKPQTTPRCDKAGNQIQYKNLNGCVNDILAIEQYLLDTLSISPSNITKLLAPYPDRKYLSDISKFSFQEPSYGNIIKTFEDITDRANTGDLLYIHFSGHGARTTTVFPMKESSGVMYDEALVPSDITRGGRYLRDVEIGSLLQTMAKRGLVVTVVLDCCHSGGAMRGEDSPEIGEVRGVSEIYNSQSADAVTVAEDSFELGDQLSWRSPLDFVVLTACQELQTAKETVRTEYAHGVLTYWLLKALRKSPADFSTQTLYEWVCGQVQENSHDQTPHLLGKNNRFFFSTEARPRQHALVVTNAKTEVWREMGERRLFLAGGMLHGVLKQSEYAILPIHFDFSNGDWTSDILARVRVTEVRPGDSTAVFLESEDESSTRVTEGCLAVLERLPISVNSTVYFADKNTRDAFEAVRTKHRSWLQVDKSDGRDAFFTVNTDDNGNLEISDLAGNMTGAVLNSLGLQPLLAQAPDSITMLRHHLEHLARYRMVKELTNSHMLPNAKPLISIVLKPWGETVEGWEGQHDLAPANIEQVGEAKALDACTAFSLVIKNQSERNLGVVVLNCSADFGVTKVFPDDESFQPIGRNKSIETGPIFMSVPKSMAQHSPPLEIFDKMKVFACDPGKDIEALCLQSLEELDEAHRGNNSYEPSPPEDLEDLLDELGPSRKANLVPKHRLSWQTLDLRFKIRPCNHCI